MTAIINTVDETQTLTVLGEAMRPMLTTEMGAPFEIFDTSGDEGMGPPPHHHDWSETYVMIEGELDVVVGDQPPRRLTAGMAVHAPGGTTHAYTIAADGARFLTILSEGNAHDFYRQMSAEVSLPPDIDDLMRITAAHGITLGG